jgi:hypothetical protein
MKRLPPAAVGLLLAVAVALLIFAWREVGALQEEMTSLKKEREGRRPIASVAPLRSPHRHDQPECECSGAQADGSETGRVDRGFFQRLSTQQGIAGEGDQRHERQDEYSRSFHRCIAPNESVLPDGSLADAATIAQ